ncbi:MAG: hypothetical protein ACOYIN_05285 [Christensenellales bacterium]|jgi:hypothetical protein|nr:hypothetical protein [Eubacteriales bacterium]
MELKLQVIKFLKTLIYLLGFPLLFLLALINSMPMFGEIVFKGFAANGILLVLAMWAVVEFVRLLFKVAMRKNGGSLRSMIVACLAVLVMVLPTYFIGQVQEKRVNEVRAEYSAYVVDGKTIEVPTYGKQEGWYRATTKVNKAERKSYTDALIYDVDDCMAFYNGVMTSKSLPYAVDRRLYLEDSYYDNWGMPEATEKQLKEGENLFVYYTGIGYKKYDADVHADKMVFYINLEDHKAEDYTPDAEKIDIGNKYKECLFYYSDGEYLLVPAVPTGNEGTLYYFMPKHPVSGGPGPGLDIWGYESYLGKVYGIKTVITREIALLQGYVDDYEAALESGPVAESDPLYLNYQIALKGDAEHYDLLSLYDIQARLSYQPSLYPIFAAKTYINIFVGVVVIGIILIGYLEEKEYAMLAVK